MKKDKDKEIEIEFSDEGKNIVITDEGNSIWQGEDIYEAFLFLEENGQI